MDILLLKLTAVGSDFRKNYSRNTSCDSCCVCHATTAVARGQWPWSNGLENDKA